MPNMQSARTHKQYCTIGIGHFHSDHYWLSMPIVQSAETHKQYCIFGIVYNAIFAVLLMGSRRLHIWHCLQCHLYSTAYGSTQIAYLALDIFTQTMPCVMVMAIGRSEGWIGGILTGCILVFTMPWLVWFNLHWPSCKVALFYTMPVLHLSWFCF